MPRNASRPLSPHLTIWRWGPHMAVSIMHRITGNGLALLGGIGLTWSFYQHTASGLRHLVLDTGAGYELRTNKFWATVTLIAPLVATGLTWLYILGVK